MEPAGHGPDGSRCVPQGFGQRFANKDLEAIGRLGRGEALIRLGETTEGASLLDEAMVAVSEGEMGRHADDRLDTW